MKKLIYVAIIAAFSSIVFSSCTDEDIQPKAAVDAPGGSGSTDKI